MTKSEQITNIISEKFFLKQYIHSDVYVKKEAQESEFCDCMIEFDEFYVVIQIKERNTDAEGDSRKWFEKKVLKKAKKQIKDTFAYYEDNANTIFSKTKDVKIDRKKKLLPLIIFLNTDIEKYERVVYSESLRSDINIFSFHDFAIMLETIVIPYDILNYLSYRTVFRNVAEGNLFIDTIDENATMLSIPKNEKDYADFFLARTYYKCIIEQLIEEDNICIYNQIVSEINSVINYERSALVEGLLCVDYVRADKIAKNWLKLLECARNEQYVEPYKIFKDEKVYMFAVHPKGMSTEEYLTRLNLSMIYCKYKWGCQFAYVITIRYVEGEQYMLGVHDFDSVERYDELVDKVVEAYEG